MARYSRLETVSLSCEGIVNAESRARPNDGLQIASGEKTNRVDMIGEVLNPFKDVAIHFFFLTGPFSFTGCNTLYIL